MKESVTFDRLEKPGIGPRLSPTVAFLGFGIYIPKRLFTSSLASAVIRAARHRGVRQRRRFARSRQTASARWAAASAAMALCLCQSVAPAWAQKGQSYPERPVRVVVSWAAGGNADVLSRILFQQLSESLGQQFVVDNRGGANGMIGSEAVVRAKPDGYTLLVDDGGNRRVDLRLSPAHSDRPALGYRVGCLPLREPGAGGGNVTAGLLLSAIATWRLLEGRTTVECDGFVGTRSSLEKMAQAGQRAGCSSVLISKSDGGRQT